MPDIASLGIEIQTDSVKQATEDLDQLNQAGAATEQAAKQAGASWSSAAAQMSKAGTPAKQTREEFEKANQKLHDQQKELSALLGKIDPVVAALGRLDDMETELGKHKNLLGTEDFAVYSQKIQGMRDALGGADDQLARTGNSAKQTAAALRMLPAQFSDIAISLQAGQSPFQVLLQQGSQIKDSFGGIGPAISSVGRYVAGLVNPFTLAAVAVGALALAYKQGSDEQTAFAKSLITTGNAAGTTTDDLAGLAKQVSNTVGTTSQAADALNQLAATGKIAQDQLQGLATAAVAWEKATGKAVSDTVAEFARLADDPVKASQQLNDQYNYLTAAVFEQIQALQEQGRANDAAKLAEDAYADSLNDRANKVKESLGTIETAWNAVKGAALSAWDAALNVGREETLDQRIERLKQQLQEVATLGSAGAQGRARFQLGLGLGGEGNLRQQLADAEGQKEQEAGEARFAAERARVNRESIAAQQELNQLRESILTKEERKQKEIANYWSNVAKVREANPFTNLFSQSQIDKDLAGIEAKYAERVAKPQAAKAYTDDAATRMLQSLRETGAELQAQLGTQDKLTAAQATQAKFQQLITDLKSKAQLTADQKSLLASQDAINAQLQMNVALDDQVQTRKELLQLEQRSAQLQETMAASNDSRQEQYQRQLDAFGMGKEQLERARSQATIFREFQRYQAQLDKATPKDLLGSEQYRTAAAEIKSGLKDALAANEDYYNKLDKLRGDWANGAKESFADYLDSAKDVAGQTYDRFNNALKGTEDAIVEFVRTGKLSFSDLADSIIADLIRIQVRQTIASGVAAFQGSGLYGSLFGGSSSNSKASAGLDALLTTSKLFSFDGGGNTGSGSRLGGVDGKGGFMAILHPQETVIDHTKPSRSQQRGGDSNVYHFNFPGVTNAKEAKQATAYAAREFNAMSQRAARFQ